MIKLPKKLDAEILPCINTYNRFIFEDEHEPELQVRFIDSSNQKVWGFLVVDDTRRGPGMGGIRIAQNLSIEEISRLAHTMTLKNSVSCLPFGGAKSGLTIDPIFLAKEPNLKSEIIDLFAEALFPFDNYISAPDMGTNEHDIQQIYKFNSKILKSNFHTRGGIGRQSIHGGIPIDDWELTAHGLVSAISTLEEMDYGIKLNGAHVVVQGFGNVGAPTSSKLYSRGSIIVGASDINGGLWNPNGLDIEELNRAKNTMGGLNNYNLKTERRFSANQVNWLLEAPCDILVPAARPDAITARNADRIQCKIILQGANSPVNKMTEYYLSNRRGILSLSDFIVNSGGVIGCAVELSMNTDTEYRKVLEKKGPRLYTENLINETISKNVKQVIYEISTEIESDTFFREKALILAHNRLRDTEEDWL